MTTTSAFDTLIRYREQTLSAAALVAALSHSTSHTVDGLECLSPRQDQQLNDLLHEMAFKGRKYLETASRLVPFLKERFEGRSVAGYKEKQGDERHGDISDAIDGLETYSMKFVFGRIVHSDNLRVHRSTFPLEDRGYSIPAGVPWAFAVRSDHDAEGEEHFVFLEFLLQQLIEADQHVEHWLPRLLAQAKVDGGVSVPTIAEPGRMD